MLNHGDADQDEENRQREAPEHREDQPLHASECTLRSGGKLRIASVSARVLVAGERVPHMT